MAFSRRQFLQHTGAATLAFAGLRYLSESATAQVPAIPGVEGYGPLLPDPKGILDLPKGFSYNVFSRTGERMSDGLFVPGKHDGMAAFPGPAGKTILVRNHETEAHDLQNSPFGPKNELLKGFDKSRFYDGGRGEKPGIGGTTTLVYDTRTGTLESHFLSLVGTIRNCAGGSTPWNTWVSCEETVQKADAVFEKDHGYCFEVPATVDGVVKNPVALEAMGRFNHEAVAVDPRSGIVYLTEDRNDGLMFRFIPDKLGVLAAGGKLQAMVIRGQKSADTRNHSIVEGGKGRLFQKGTSYEVEWIDMENVQAPQDDLRYRGFDQGAARFARGEGIIWGNNAIYIACTNGGPAKKGQIWRYVPSAQEGRPEEKNVPGKLELFIEAEDGTLIENCDNIAIAPWGDIIISEDGNAPQYVVGVTPRGGSYQIARNAVSKAEFAGSIFSPDGSTLFVNIQTPGMTLAITGPWNNHKLA
jgi:secreted PhoX family phosphatase